MNIPKRSIKDRHKDSVENILDELKCYADIMRPKSAQAPILSSRVQNAVEEWIAEIRFADDFVEANMQPRRACLLYGPPGTGKTTLAHAFASRLGLPLVAIASERLIGSYLGETGRNLGKMFDLIDSISDDCIVLFDEFDSLAGRRSSEKGGGAISEMNRSLNVILRRIETYKGVTIAATNLPDAIDPAMWRRFGLQIEVALPGTEERFAILKRYAAPFDMSDDDFDVLTYLTRGSSPSLIKQLMDGMKRHLIMAPRMKREIGSAREVFSSIIASIFAPPEMPTPPLWSSTTDLALIDKITWPPKRTQNTNKTQTESP